MLENKQVLIIVGVLSLLVICLLWRKYKNKQVSFEKFGMLPSRTFYVDREVSPQKGMPFVSYPNYQAALSPRFTNQPLGAYITQKLPEAKYMASPKDPLSFGDMVNESYCGKDRGTTDKRMKPDYAEGNYKEVLDSAEKTKESYCSGRQFQAGAVMKSGFADGNYNELTKTTTADLSGNLKMGILPVGDMTTINALGVVEQPRVIDRFITANRNSRLRSQGDKIRGDLPIVPNNNSGWFNVSVHPNIDLEQGAMNVMAGQNGNTTRDMANLIFSYSGGAQTTIGGVNMANEFSTSLSGGMGDVNVTAFI